MSTSGPARQPGRAGPSPSKRGRLALAAAGRFAKRRPGVILGVVCVLGCGGAIGWNALTQQANRHPAPLFGPRSAAAKIEPVRRPEMAAVAGAPAPVPLPVRRPEIVAPVTVAAPPQAVVEVPARPAGADPIGALIRASDPSSQPENRADPKLTTAQKALTKLGYGPLRPDGLMGATTRQALERFERDHKLPVTGTLGQRTTRQLASVTGTKID